MHSPSSKRAEQLVDLREGIVLTPKNVQVFSYWIYMNCLPVDQFYCCVFVSIQFMIVLSNIITYRL